jgi:hypothetical protein
MLFDKFSVALSEAQRRRRICGFIVIMNAANPKPALGEPKRAPFIVAARFAFAISNPFAPLYIYIAQWRP